MAIVSTLQSSTGPETSTDDRVAKHFAGPKAAWRSSYYDLLSTVKAFGSDVNESPAESYISLVRGSKKFAIVAVSTQRMDIGIKLKGIEPTERFESSANWNTMVTHRARIDDPAKVDDELLLWLRQAYDSAG